ncbi:phage shock protein C (PspC) family protein [Goodfellowiella coeruleoviolacea]|uniref:Phage shock protein C (PspC) family protein n=1 Tax=Goodfellowiella coeruleoviolacea TaxID=334858 RepID=A0AAE3KEX1_9PSEU|nr:ATP-binding protein [Goodfellowiella coeruleoviolacea]MCP2165756.1 phage shock protein C (PspC) family protein [Goodfellowiella coeruleoviolacea]
MDPVSQAEPNRAPVLPEPPRMRRRRSSKAVAGVAGGLADHLGVEVFWVRVAFALLAAFAGLGVVAYGLLWMFVPQESARVPVREQTAKERQQAVGLVALGLGLAVVAGLLQGSVGGWLAGPLGVVLVGAAVVWREADEAQRRRWRDGARTGWLGVVLGEGGRNALVRVLAGAVLVTTGLVIFLVNTPSLNQLQFVLLAVFATLVGVAVLTVPWWVRLSRDLSEERRARIRTEERAEIAAHLHDSVLQTLALIQKQAESAREVRRLARGQERELRNWLYGPSGYGKGNQVSADAPADLAGATDQARTTLAAAVATACGEVEDIFAIRVQQVVVGDCPLDDQLVALVQAAREAVVNAAKHAGVAEVSVYAEVEPERVEVFVRDRGKGFDPNAVSADRHGLADSIQGRMERHGGDVRLRTAPGEGTEVQLGMPRRSTKEARA